MSPRDNNPYDDDHDGRPGGRGFSREFAEKYDQQGEQEYTNLPLALEQLEEAEGEQQLVQHHENARRLREAEGGRIHFWPNVGKFVIPKQNTYAAHAQLVRSGGGMDLGFSPAKYLFFDRLVADAAQRPDIFDPAHPEYARYRPLRENLAVLRNDIMGIYMDDGSFDPGDEKYVPILANVAVEIGKAIHREQQPIPRFFSGYLDTRLLNMEGDGAAHAYRYLLAHQRGFGPGSGIVSDVMDWAGTDNRQWGLPPVAFTPFSEPGLNASPPPDELCMTRAELHAMVGNPSHHWRNRVHQERAQAGEVHHATPA